MRSPIVATTYRMSASLSDASESLAEHAPVTHDAAVDGGRTPEVPEVRPGPRAAISARHGSEVELEHADGVAAHELVHDSSGRPGHQLLRDLLRVRPRRVGVRVVGLEGDVVDADLRRATSSPCWSRKKQPYTWR